MDNSAQLTPSTALIAGFREVNIIRSQRKGLLALPNETLLHIIYEVARLEPLDEEESFPGSSYIREFKHLGNLALTCSLLYNLSQDEFYDYRVFHMAFEYSHVSILDRFTEFDGQGLPDWFTEPCLRNRYECIWELIYTTIENFAFGKTSLQACFDTIKWYRDFRRRPPRHTPCTNCSTPIPFSFFREERFIWIDDEGDRLERLLKALIKDLGLPGERLLQSQMKLGMPGMVSWISAGSQARMLFYIKLFGMFNASNLWKICSALG